MKQDETTNDVYFNGKATFDTDGFLRLKANRGDKVNCIKIGFGNPFLVRVYEVYTDEEFNAEMHRRLNGTDIEVSQFNYLLYRISEINDGSKVGISYNVYEPYKDDCRIADLNQGYTVSLIGTYKDGVFDGKVYNSSIK